MTLTEVDSWHISATNITRKWIALLQKKETIQILSDRENSGCLTYCHVQHLDDFRIGRHGPGRGTEAVQTSWHSWGINPRNQPEISDLRRLDSVLLTYLRLPGEPHRISFIFLFVLQARNGIGKSKGFLSSLLHKFIDFKRPETKPTGCTDKLCCKTIENTAILKWGQCAGKH